LPVTISAFHSLAQTPVQVAVPLGTWRKKTDAPLPVLRATPYPGTFAVATVAAAVLVDAGLEAGGEVDCELFGDDDEPHAATSGAMAAAAVSARSELATRRRLGFEVEMAIPATISRKWARSCGGISLS
jgi:hypothetical protein